MARATRAAAELGFHSPPPEPCCRRLSGQRVLQKAGCGASVGDSASWCLQAGATAPAPPPPGQRRCRPAPAAAPLPLIHSRRPGGRPWLAWRKAQVAQADPFFGHERPTQEKGRSAAGSAPLSDRIGAGDYQHGPVGAAPLARLASRAVLAIAVIFTTTALQSPTTDAASVGFSRCSTRLRSIAPAEWTISGSRGGTAPSPHAPWSRIRASTTRGRSRRQMAIAKPAGIQLPAAASQADQHICCQDRQA